jgi:uncharacterized protein (DUF1810 family)
MSVRFAIRSDAEARAYLAHLTLGARRTEYTALVEAALRRARRSPGSSASWMR